MHIEMFGDTDVGLVRQQNEDVIAVYPESGLMLLADGMGGEQAGEVAAALAVRAARAVLTESLESLPGSGGGKPKVPRLRRPAGLVKAVRRAIALANKTVYEESRRHKALAGMGTTLVVGLFSGKRLYVGHMGDSRLYRYRDENLAQLTVDHSYVQELVDEGIMSAEEAAESEHKNIVTRALGVVEEEEVDVDHYLVRTGDIYLACSDGLTDMVKDQAIASVIMTHGDNLQVMTRALISLAKEAGGHDNISVILSRVASS